MSHESPGIDKDHLDCPFCRKSGDGIVYIKSDRLRDDHFDGLLSDVLGCPKCGATAEKRVGCCSIKYYWSKKQSAEEIYRDVSRFECSDCGEKYYAKIQRRGDLLEIGERVPEPPAGIAVPRQRMLCGNCQGKGGKGDLLNDLLRGQRARDALNDLMR